MQEGGASHSLLAEVNKISAIMFCHQSVQLTEKVTKFVTSLFFLKKRLLEVGV